MPAKRISPEQLSRAMHGRTATTMDIETTLERIAAKERRRQSIRAVLVVGALAVFAIFLIVLNAFMQG
jgi:hypothetical protein